MAENPLLNKVRAAARKAAGAGIAGAKGPQQPAQPPAPASPTTPEPITPPAAPAPAPSVPSPKPVGSMPELITDLNDPAKQAEKAVRIGAKEMQDTRTAIQKIEQEIEELKRQGADKDAWGKALGIIESERANINRLSSNLQSARAGIAASDQKELLQRISDTTHEVAALAERLERVRKDAAATQKTTPDKSLTKAVAGRHTSAPIRDGTLDTALHHAAEKTKDTGGVGVELGREIEAMQTKIDARFVTILSVMDQAVGRIVDNKAYGFDGETIVPLNSYSPDFKNPLEAYRAQLKATMEAANDFAEIVKVLPQEVMNLTVELQDTERNFLAKLNRESNPPATVPPTVPPFDPAAAPTSVTTSAIKLSQIDVGKEPPLDVGKREAGRALGGALTTLDAIENLKTHIDAQIILILSTIDEVMSRALNGEAYTDAGGKIAAVTNDPNPVNRLETTVRTASDLIGILERLPQEVTSLVTEIHDAEKQIADAFDVYQAKPSN